MPLVSTPTKLRPLSVFIGVVTCEWFSASELSECAER